jgi:pimeloyl-ACP methyl ester carboxylesterase
MRSGPTRGGPTTYDRPVDDSHAPARPPEQITLDAGPVRLAALDYGPGRGDRTTAPMLMLHGQADLAWSMDSVAQAFRDRYHVVSVDLRGHGHSDQPGAYSLLHLVADLRAAVRQLGFERPVIVGHSLGGHAAAQYCGLYPEVPRALVLVEGMGPPAKMHSSTADERDAVARAHVDLLLTPLAHKPLRDLDAAVARLAAAHPRLHPARARFLAEVGTRPGPDGGLVWRFDPRTRDWIASIDHEQTETRWRQVRCPVLAISGADSWDTWWSARLSPVAQAQRRERLTPEEWHARLANFPDVEEVVLPDAGHMVQFDQPERLNEVIDDFLRRRVA